MSFNYNEMVTNDDVFQSGQDVEEIEDLLNNTDDILVVSYTSLTLNKFALESQYHDTVFALQSVISQMALIY